MAFRLYLELLDNTYYGELIMLRKYYTTLYLANFGNFTLCILFIINFCFFSALADKNAEARPKNVIFLVHTAQLGGKGLIPIYHAMKKDKHKIKIVAIPLVDKGKLMNPIDQNFLKNFDQRDVLFPCGKEEPYTKCSSIESLNPEYIFIHEPYNVFKESILDPHFTNQVLKKVSKKLMHIVYGPYVFNQESDNRSNLPQFVDTVFVDSQSGKDVFIKGFKFPPERVIISGYQTYKDVRDKLKNKVLNKNNDVTTVLWLPRWWTSFSIRDLFEGGSTFFNYHYFFYDYARENPKIKLILRPHPLLFCTAVEQKFISQQDLDSILDRFSSLKNVRISDSSITPLVDDVLEADLVVSDGSSALGEVIVADKPIIYLSNGSNNEFNSTEISRELRKHILIAYDPVDILTFINRIESDKKTMYIRDAFGKKLAYEKFKSIVDPVDNPAEFISQYLLNDCLE